MAVHLEECLYRTMTIILYVYRNGLGENCILGDFMFQ